VVGSDPAHANLIKLLGNMMTATALEAIAETVAVLLKRDLDPKLFIDILINTMFGGLAHRKIRRQDCPAGLHGPGFCLAPSAQGRAIGACRGRNRRERHFHRQGWCATASSRESHAGMPISIGRPLGLIAAQEAGLQVEPPAGPANQSQPHA